MQNAIILCATARFRTLVYEKTDVHTYANENTNLRCKTLPEPPSEPQEGFISKSVGWYDFVFDK